MYQEQKHSTSVNSVSVPVTTEVQSIAPSLNPTLTNAVTQSELTSTSYGQPPPVGVYNQMGFSPYSFGMNQQSYMFGAPGYSQFPGVPPPVISMPNISPLEVNSALKNDKATQVSSKSNNYKITSFS